MRHQDRARAALVAGAALLLVAGVPGAARARNGGALLGGGRPMGGGGVLAPRDGSYVPPPGSPVRKAILDALRRKVGQVSGKYVVFSVQMLRVQSGWARAVVRPQSPGGGTTYDRISAVLAARGGQWRIVHIAQGASVTTDPVKLRRLYPEAPPGIF